MKGKVFSISKAAEYLGVYPLTLRNWEKKGLITTFRTPGGHRRYEKNTLDKIRDMNGTGSKLEAAINRLEEMELGNGRQMTIDDIITDLRSISGEV